MDEILFVYRIQTEMGKYILDNLFIRTVNKNNFIGHDIAP